MAGDLPRTGHVPGLSAAVLAGGQSRRMGQDKLALPFGRGTVLSTVLDTLAALSDDVFVVGREVPGWRSVADLLPERCALSGVHAALKSARHDRVLIVGGDMPCLQEALLRLVVERDGVPRGQPLCAVYPAADCTRLEEMWARGERSVNAFAAERPVIEEALLRSVDADLRSFLNLNTPQDLTILQQLETRS